MTLLVVRTVVDDQNRLRASHHQRRLKVRETVTAPFAIWCDDIVDRDGEPETLRYETNCQMTNLSDTKSLGYDLERRRHGSQLRSQFTQSQTSPQKHLSHSVVAGVRVDASALEVTNRITASITSTTDATSVPLGGGSAEGGVAGVVGEVAAGLKVTADQRRRVWLVQPRLLRLPLRFPKAIVGAWGPTTLNLDNDGPGDQTDEQSASVMDCSGLACPMTPKSYWPEQCQQLYQRCPLGSRERGKQS